MTPVPGTGTPPPALRCAVVLRVHEQACEVWVEGQRLSVGYVTSFPSPRTERVCPGQLVALAAMPGGPVVVWRWFDAVVLGEEAGRLRLWEPAHGEVLAEQRPSHQPRRPGTRAYLSAGLPGADWWVAGPVVATPEEAEVELDEVDGFCRDHGVWDLLPAS
jgi:hypothetical protein